MPPSPLKCLVLVIMSESEGGLSGKALEVLIEVFLSILNQGHAYFQSADYLEFTVWGQGGQLCGLPISQSFKSNK